MEIKILKEARSRLAEITSKEILIGKDVQEALDLMASCSYQGAEGMLLYEHQFTKDFFDLKTGLAGEILQKFSTYQMRMAIIGDFEKYSSTSFRDFRRESHRQVRIIFAGSREEAIRLMIG